ncbi:16S rRNA (uracil1498-N3)-methyltransferase [Spirosomataceae bacterium TFI 002]|nr:16S rRNA (uracil1498-N3)-methyltransferase [Spirosomataceae bacterium TFI 002]
MQLFYQPNFVEPFTLDADDSRHCVKVLRKQNGDKIHVVDGKGGLFHCEIIDANTKSCSLEVLEKTLEWNKSKRYIHIAIAPTKNIDRITYFVEKAVEIGINEISFILCKNSERKVVKTDRIERIAVSAMKQSLKAYIPKINELESLKSFIAGVESEQCLVAHLSEDSNSLMATSLNENVLLLIGPEGDFDPAELVMLNEAGYKQVTMGESRLRTETAGLVGVTLLNLM